MGQCCNSSGYDTFTAGTLNYSGIMKSPVQYYSETGYKQQKQLNRLFMLQMSQHELTSGKDFQWKLGDIDKNMQTERYAPFYNPRIGVQKKRFLSNYQFELKWQQVFKENAKKIKNFNYKPQDVRMAKTFDLLSYRALVRYAYKKELEKVDPQDVFKYLDYTDSLFKKPFMDHKKKIKKTIDFIQNVDLDIMFLQQVDKVIITEINSKNQFLIKFNEKSQSAILVRKRVINGQDNTNKVLQLFTKEQIENFNWNKDTVILCVNNFFLISAHLSSKSQKNTQQVQQMYKDLDLIQKRLPNFHIVLGMDSNNDNIQAPRGYQLYPDKKQMNTVYKMRTHMQVQTKKAGQLSNKRSDYILTNVDMKKGQIVTIDGQPIHSEYYLPSMNHPFDHFLVFVQFNQNILHDYKIK